MQEKEDNGVQSGEMLRKWEVEGDKLGEGDFPVCKWTSDRA